MRNSYSFITLGVRGGILIQCSVLSCGRMIQGYKPIFQCLLPVWSAAASQKEDIYVRSLRAGAWKSSGWSSGSGCISAARGKQAAPATEPREAAAFSAAQEGLTGSKSTAEPWECWSSHSHQLKSFTTPWVLSSLKTDFHSKVDGFKINCLKK